MADSINPASESSEQIPTAPQQAAPLAAPGPVPENSAGQEQPLQHAQAALAQVGSILNKAGATLTQKPAQPQAPTTTTERLWGALSYIPMVALISLLTNPASDFVKLHAKQGLMIFIVFFSSFFVFDVLLYLILGNFGIILGQLVQLAMVVLGIFSFYQAITGNWWKIPFIYQIADQLPVDLFTKVTTEAITGQAPVTQTPTIPPAPLPEDKSQTTPPESQNQPPVTPA